MSTAPACHHCGRPCDPSRSGFDPRNPRCAECEPLSAHTVSMRGCPGNWQAVCACGWSCETPHRAVRERAVRQHWREVMREARQ